MLEGHYPPLFQPPGQDNYDDDDGDGGHDHCSDTQKDDDDQVVMKTEIEFKLLLNSDLHRLLLAQKLVTNKNTSELRPIKWKRRLKSFPKKKLHLVSLFYSFTVAIFTVGWIHKQNASLFVVELAQQLYNCPLVD